MQQLQKILEGLSDESLIIGPNTSPEVDELLTELAQSVEEPNFLAEGFSPLTQVIYNQLIETLEYPDEPFMDPNRVFKRLVIRLSKVLSLLFEGKLTDDKEL